MCIRDSTLAAYVFAAHGTSIQGLTGILSEEIMRGSRTLDYRGFWGMARPYVDALEEQWEVVEAASCMRGLNRTDVLVGMSCPCMQWEALDAADHELEASIVARGVASHLRASGRKRWAIPLACGTIKWLFVLPTGLEGTDGYYD